MQNTRHKRRSAILEQSSRTKISNSASNLELAFKQPASKSEISITDVYNLITDLTSKHESLEAEIRNLNIIISDFQTSTNALTKENIELRNNIEIHRQRINHFEGAIKRTWNVTLKYVE